MLFLSLTFSFPCPASLLTFTAAQRPLQPRDAISSTGAYQPPRPLSKRFLPPRAASPANYKEPAFSITGLRCGGLSIRGPRALLRAADPSARRRGAVQSGSGGAGAHLAKNTTHVRANPQRRAGEKSKKSRQARATQAPLKTSG